MATPILPKINFSQNKSESRRSSGDAHEKCGYTPTYQEVPLCSKLLLLFTKLKKIYSSFFSSLFLAPSFTTSTSFSRLSRLDPLLKNPQYFSSPIHSAQFSLSPQMTWNSHHQREYPLSITNLKSSLVLPLLRVILAHISLYKWNLMLPRVLSTTS